MNGRLVIGGTPLNLEEGDYIEVFISARPTTVVDAQVTVVDDEPMHENLETTMTTTAMPCTMNCWLMTEPCLVDPTSGTAPGCIRGVL